MRAGKFKLNCAVGKPLYASHVKLKMTDDEYLCYAGPDRPVHPAGVYHSR
jgi:hypothetical protein